MTNGAFKPSWTIPQKGQTIAGKYLIDGVCGRGEFAVVLSATHAALAQRVAIKMLQPEWAGDEEVVERFERDGHAATQIKSEHVVRVFDVGWLETGAPYWVLEYLEGNNLRDVLAMWGPLPVATAVDWVLQAAEAIAEAHAYGIVHPDLTPANLFLTSRTDGSACIKVIDFGLSNLPDPRMLGATAPEQLRGTREADARTDVWALGSVLHELLSGQPPFYAETMPDLFAAVLTQPPPRLSSLREGIPPDVEKAVLRCLEKDPSARFSDTGELSRALASFGTDSSRRSQGRIERVLASSGGADDFMSLPPLLPDARFSWPELENEALPRGKSASAKIVLGSVLILGGAAAAAFLGMHSCVHGDETKVATTQPETIGVAEHQPMAALATGIVLPPSASVAASVAPVALVPIPTTAVSVAPQSAPPPASAAQPRPQPPAPTSVSTLAVKPLASSQAMSPPRVVQPAPTKVRRYTVEPEPVPAPAARHREEPASTATTTAPTQTPIAVPAPSSTQPPPSASPAPSTTDDLFDTRK